MTETVETQRKRAVSTAGSSPGADETDEKGFTMIHSYHNSHATARTFYSLKRGTPGTLKVVADPGARAFVGVELEIEAGSADRRELSDKVDALMGNLATCEGDGSLRNGFEIITQPATVPAFLNGFKIDDLTDMLNAEGAESHDTSTCGLHVHYSRAALGHSDETRDMVCAKILVLMDKFENQLTCIARRNWTDNSYTHKYYGFNGSGENSTKKLLAKFAPCKSSDDRYHALNLTNTGTIEFRIFRGTLNATAIRAAVELCETLVKYSQTHTTPEVQGCTWSEFLSTCQHPDLAKYCTERGIA